MNTDKLVSITEQTLRSNLNMGLVFGSAMAWNEVIRTFIEKFLKNKGGEYYIIIYALAMTFIMIMYQFVSQRNLYEKKFS